MRSGNPDYLSQITLWSNKTAHEYKKLLHGKKYWWSKDENLQYFENLPFNKKHQTKQSLQLLLVVVVEKLYTQKSDPG